MNKLDKDYQNLLRDILENGTKKQDRTGTGTLSVFGRQLRHDFRDGFPLLTTKRMAFKQIVTELIWFLRGDTNIKFLVDNDCHIWDGDAYKNYKTKTEMMMGHGFHGTLLSQEEFINKIKTDDEFAKKWGELGPVYGKQWRNWKKAIGIGYSGGISIDGSRINNDPQIAYDTIDQIQNLINDLKTNPDSRRLMVNAWNVGELDGMVLPPCHYGFQVYTRELSVRERLVYWYDNSGNDIFPEGNIDSNNLDKLNVPKRAISLMWNQRSVDTFLGLPFNIASYGLLLEIIAKEVNMVPDQLIGNLGDVHLYTNHIEQAKEQIGRELSLEERHQLALPIWKEKYGPLADMMVMTNVDNTPYKIPKRTREPYPLPTLKIKSINDNHMIYPKLLPLTGEEEFYEISDFILENYQSHPTIKAPLSN